MSEKEDIREECDDDDEWGDLITTPNRLIPDEFFVLKAEEMDDLQVDDEKSRIVSVTERRTAYPGSDCINGSRIGFQSPCRLLMLGLSCLHHLLDSALIHCQIRPLCSLILRKLDMVVF